MSFMARFGEILLDMMRFLLDLEKSHQIFTNFCIRYLMRMHSICGIHTFWIEALNHLISILVRFQGNQPNQLTAQTFNLILVLNFSYIKPHFHYPNGPDFQYLQKLYRNTFRRAKNVSIRLIFNHLWLEDNLLLIRVQNFQLVQSFSSTPPRVIKLNLTESFKSFLHTFNCGSRFQLRGW